MATTFQGPFVEPLLRISLAPAPDVRLAVQKILHTLIDRHNNLDKLLKPRFVSSETDGIRNVETSSFVVWIC